MDFPPSVRVQEQVTWHVAVTNYGPSLATQVQLTDGLSAGMTFVAATSSQGSCAVVDNVVSCALGDLGSGAGATVALTARA